MSVQRTLEERRDDLQALEGVLDLGDRRVQAVHHAHVGQARDGLDGAVADALAEADARAALGRLGQPGDLSPEVVTALLQGSLHGHAHELRH
ncbi:MAG TPA: hypothetical protein VFY44_03280, partial [Thermoleophilaceae bacterium]|nr:hypothetical protein [Thermoleophilaceae bacterium]